MINCLNIYKFSFPFIKEKYEEVLFHSIFNDLENLFLYEEILENIENKEDEDIKSIVLIFKDWKIELLLNKTNNYYIPKFQLNLLFENKINNDLIIKIIPIFEALWLKNYIFDYNKSKINLDNFKLIDAKYLTNNFEKYNYKELNSFLKKMNKDYLKEELKENNIIFFSFTYLIFRSFIFYKNYITSKNTQEDIKNLDKNISNKEYLSVLELSRTRLEHIDDLNLVTFKKYKKMLDAFFNLLK